MSINLGDFRKRNMSRKGQAKQDVDTLIDLAERLHNALLAGGRHSDECRKGPGCMCGLEQLVESVSFDFDIHIKRKQGLFYFPALQPPTLTDIYERFGQ